MMNDLRPAFFGKYRGKVTDNRDPNNLGRIKAKVPDVLGDEDSGWALPCVPYAGQNVGMMFIPPNDALVWIEFEHGDPDYPIWTGCFWAQSDLLTVQPSPDKKVIKTVNGTITLDDTAGAGGITIETINNMKIVIDTQGIEINDGQGAVIKLSTAQVSINNGALEVI